uniref:SusD/RagB family nutrient-binding outer membrane lipoprotein n=1 Tax=Cecembia sp. TaxID=1898110 RepID=UPI0025BADC13
LEPCNPKLSILGASSDHLLLDISGDADSYQVGDKVDFIPGYGALLQAMTSAYVTKKVILPANHPEPRKKTVTLVGDLFNETRYSRELDQWIDRLGYRSEHLPQDAKVEDLAPRISLDSLPVLGGRNLTKTGLQSAAKAIKHFGLLWVDSVITSEDLNTMLGNRDDEVAQALDLDNIPQPRFDDAAVLYQRVQTLLDEGIADLNRESSTSPSTNDLIYRANNETSWRQTSLPKWIMLANAMKARFHNHLSKVDPTGSAVATLAAIDAGTFSSNADHPVVLFGSEFAGPWFPFFQTTFGENNVAISQRFIDLLRDRIDEGKDDPRLVFFVSPNTGGLYLGTPNGSASRPTGSVFPGPYLNSREAPTPILNFSELKFIEAEAALRAGQEARAAEAHNLAVAASLQRITGTLNEEYIERYGAETGASISLEKIMIEKHIDLFLQPEAWTDWRRTTPVGAPNSVSGLPLLEVSPTNTTQGLFPRRFIYPNREIVNNSANVPDVSNLDRVFWDR